MFFSIFFPFFARKMKNRERYVQSVFLVGPPDIIKLNLIKIKSNRFFSLSQQLDFKTQNEKKGIGNGFKRKKSVIIKNAEAIGHQNHLKLVYHSIGTYGLPFDVNQGGCRKSENSVGFNDQFAENGKD